MRLPPHTVARAPYQPEQQGLGALPAVSSNPQKQHWQQMPLLEEEKAALEQQLSGGLTDPQAIAEASARYEQVQRALDEAELRWLELNE